MADGEAQIQQFRELVDLFLGELPERVASILRAADEERFDEVLRLSHQIKGGAPGYGFVGVGDAAGRLESAVRALHEGGSPLEEVREALDSLVQMADRACESGRD
ncbi:MAG: Hpt domain-containing protein [Phycisphaerales bacterium JB037]